MLNLKRYLLLRRDFYRNGYLRYNELLEMYNLEDELASKGVDISKQLETLVEYCQRVKGIEVPV